MDSPTYMLMCVCLRSTLKFISVNFSKIIIVNNRILTKSLEELLGLDVTSVTAGKC